MSVEVPADPNGNNRADLAEEIVEMRIIHTLIKIPNVQGRSLRGTLTPNQDLRHLTQPLFSSFFFLFGILCLHLSSLVIKDKPYIE